MRFCRGTENHLDLTSLLIESPAAGLLPIERVSRVLKRLRQLKEKSLRGSKASGTRQRLMTLKIFLGMEWMLILGGDLGLYIYLFFLVLFGPKYCKANGDWAFSHFLSSLLRCAVRSTGGKGDRLRQAT
jgi:hypothetical protein